MATASETISTPTLPTGNASAAASAIWVPCLIIPVGPSATISLPSGEQSVNEVNIENPVILSAGLKLDMHEIEDSYAVRDASGVQSFLTVHPQLVDLLLDARTHIRRYFSEAPVYLYLEAAFESPSQDRRLVVSIDTDMDARSAVAQLRAFDYDWWLDQSQNQEGLVLFTLE